jgi:farnesyl-diphosphate farnesyltransferase
MTQQLLLDAVSRSFAFVIPMVEPNKREALANQYLLARLLDTIEDSNHSIMQKRELIGLFFDVLERRIHGENSIQEQLLTPMRSATIQDTDKFLIDHALYVFTVFFSLSEALQVMSIKWLKEMAQGMMEYLQKAILSFDDLDDYCYYVAGTVGLYLTDLVKIQDGVELDTTNAIANGRYLQKVNIIKDFHGDFQEGRVFWPKELFQNTTVEAVTTGKAPEDEQLRILSAMNESACREEAASFAYIMSIPKQLKGYRDFCLIPAMMAYQTLRKMHNNQKVLLQSEGIKIGRKAVKQMLLQNKLGLYPNYRLKKMATIHRSVLDHKTNQQSSS